MARPRWTIPRPTSMIRPGSVPSRRGWRRRNLEGACHDVVVGCGRMVGVVALLAAAVGCRAEAVVAPAAAPDNAPFARGVNLGNALEAPTEGEWGVVLQADYFDHIAEAGFDTVRIPIRWSTHAPGACPPTPSTLMSWLASTGPWIRPSLTA